MITSAEVVELLKVASTYDSRKPSEKLRDAWLEAGAFAHWTFDEASSAIRQHYATQSEWIMPGHVTALILAKRHQARPSSPAARPVRQVLDDRNPDEVITSEADRLAFLADIRRAIATKGADLDTDDADAVDTRRADPTDDGDACLSDACPWCRASIGNRCTSRGRPLRFRSCHPARAEAKTERLSRA